MIPSLLSTILTLRKFPLLLHIIIESAAAYTFMLKPSCQLPKSLSSSTPRRPEVEDPTPLCSSSSTCAGCQPSKRCLSPSSPTKINTTQGANGDETHEEYSNSDNDHNELLDTATKTELNLVLLNYGGLLLTSNLICLIFLLRPVFDEVSGLVSLCMATYHVWPVYRAIVRMRLYNNNRRCKEGGNQAAAAVVLGGPPLHLLVHLGLFVGLVWGGVSI